MTLRELMEQNKLPMGTRVRLRRTAWASEPVTITVKVIGDITDNLGDCGCGCCADYFDGDEVLSYSLPTYGEEIFPESSNAPSV